MRPQTSRNCQSQSTVELERDELHIWGRVGERALRTSTENEQSELWERNPAKDEYNDVNLIFSGDRSSEQREHFSPSRARAENVADQIFVGGLSLHAESPSTLHLHDCELSY